MECEFVKVVYTIHDKASTPLIEEGNGTLRTGIDFKLASHSPGMNGVVVISSSDKTNGDIEFGGVKDLANRGSVKIAFEAAFVQTNSHGKTYTVSNKHPTIESDPKQAVWISSSEIKPTIAGDGGGAFSKFQYGALDDCGVKEFNRASVVFEMDAAKLPRGKKHSYALATALTDSGGTKHLMRSDPQIKNTGSDTRPQYGFSMAELLITLALALLLGALASWRLTRRYGGEP